MLSTAFNACNGVLNVVWNEITSNAAFNTCNGHKTTHYVLQTTLPHRAHRLEASAGHQAPSYGVVLSGLRPRDTRSTASSGPGRSSALPTCPSTTTSVF
eukprot:2011064-Pyramimonas_sp.AAC.1